MPTKDHVPLASWTVSSRKRDPVVEKPPDMIEPEKKSDRCVGWEGWEDEIRRTRVSKKSPA